MRGGDADVPPPPNVANSHEKRDGWSIASRVRAAPIFPGGRPSAAAIAQATLSVQLFLQAVSAEEIAITAEIGRAAVATSARYGKVVGHPADLNFGDCFAYACAMEKLVPLLFKGDDFSQTDIVSALGGR